MKIDNAVALVTGANRGIGLAFAAELLARGARKVYATARDPASVTQPGVQPLRLDVNDPEQVAAAAALASDVTLVINNAGIAQPGGFLAADSEEVTRRIFETNFFGMLRVSKAVTPTLERQGGGAFLNVLSVSSWVSGGGLAAYSASKSAAWSLTNALRIELARQKTQVLALHHGLRRHRPDAGIRRAEVQPGSDRQTGPRRTGVGPRRSAGRRAHGARQGGPDRGTAQLSSLAGMKVSRLPAPGGRWTSWRCIALLCAVLAGCSTAPLSGQSATPACRHHHGLPRAAGPGDSARRPLLPACDHLRRRRARGSTGPRRAGSPA